MPTASSALKAMLRLLGVAAQLDPMESALIGVSTSLCAQKDSVKLPSNGLVCGCGLGSTTLPVHASEYALLALPRRSSVALALVVVPWLPKPLSSVALPVNEYDAIRPSRCSS